MEKWITIFGIIVAIVAFYFIINCSYTINQAGGQLLILTYSVPPNVKSSGKNYADYVVTDNANIDNSEVIAKIQSDAVIKQES